MKRYVAAAVMAGLMIVMAVVGLPAQAQKPSRAALDAALLAESAGLASRPAPADLNAGPYLRTYAEITAYAENFVRTLPLPQADSLEDVNFIAAADQGGTSASLLEFVVLNNLRCDWYNAAAGDSENAGVARAIVRDIPRWGAFKAPHLGGEVAQRSARIADGLAARDLGALRAELAGPNCNPAVAVRAVP